jgi:hypothetical protein
MYARSAIAKKMVVKIMGRIPGSAVNLVFTSTGGHGSGHRAGGKEIAIPLAYQN